MSSHILKSRSSNFFGISKNIFFGKKTKNSEILAEKCEVFSLIFHEKWLQFFERFWNYSGVVFSLLFRCIQFRKANPCFNFKNSNFCPITQVFQDSSLGFDRIFSQFRTFLPFHSLLSSIGGATGQVRFPNCVEETGHRREIGKMRNFPRKCSHNPISQIQTEFLEILTKMVNFCNF